MTKQNPRSLKRRQFLKLLLLTGGLAACGGRTGEDVQPTDSPLPPTQTPIPVLPTSSPISLDVRYTLEGDAVNYAPHPEGCAGTTITGSVKDASGAGVPGLMIRLWTDDANLPVAIQTDANGEYALYIDLGGTLTDQTYHLQVADESGTLLLSEVIVAQAIPRCELNVMTVNFISIP